MTAGRLSLRRLAALLRNMPLDGTAVWRQVRRETPATTRKATSPPDEWWSPERDLMASILDTLNILAWQRTKDGHEGRNPPPPTRRPGAVAAPRKGDPTKRVATLLAMAGRSGEGADDPGGEHPDDPDRTE